MFTILKWTEFSQKFYINDFLKQFANVFVMYTRFFYKQRSF